jgi:sterol desaturase/sphingolipid hydroxylase (fatty acid hydroxylase superfamily)
LLFEPIASVRLDLLSVVSMELVPLKRLGYVLSFGLLYALDVHAAHSTTASITNLLPWWGLQILFVLLFQSLVLYWMHRLEHTIPALWALHKFHHSADNMSILNAERQTHLVVGEGVLVSCPCNL